MIMPHWRYVKWGAAAVIVAAAAMLGLDIARRTTYTDAELQTFVYNGPWYTDEYGSQKASAATRAYVAVVGLLALNRQETLYYIAHQDDEGHELSSDYVYEISGGDMPTRWWSVTLYGADHFLIDNPQSVYSVKGTDIEREADGSFRVLLSKEPQAGNWIPMNAESEHVSLLLRMYNPKPEALDRLQDIELPSIRRVRSAS